MKRFLIGAIRLYQKTFSKWKIRPTCRFEPTCSAYALEALEKKGAFRGSLLALKRILKCHPFHPGGYDPVEESIAKER
jgi:putative membrane protein insertion efficiency factor